MLKNIIENNKEYKNINHNDTLQKLNGNCKNTQPEVTAELSDPKILDARLNNVAPPSVMNKKEESLL